ncbi:MAG: polysaccharide deacetylase family protein, partial [Bacteroidaceae bacterium]|nr:polysaccharide deacetylase family protein [Bacteroidaceae bacterium]
MTKIILLFFFSMVGLSLSAQPLTVRVAPFYQGRQAALSLTFDDGLQEHFTLLRPELNRRGLRATFAIVGSKVGG